MKNNNVLDLYRVLRQASDLQFVMKVGLFPNSNLRKLDILAGFTGDIRIHGQVIMNLFQKHWSKGKFHICDDSIRFELPSVSGGVAICDSHSLVEQVKIWVSGNNLEGQHRVWAPGYWLPEALCGDIAAADIVHDKTNMGNLLKQMVSVYPKPLSRAIVELTSEEISQKISLYSKLRTEDYVAEASLCVSDIAKALIRLSFAQSMIYLRGFRLLRQQVDFLSPSNKPLFYLALNLLQRKKEEETIQEIQFLF